jgi:hypothetical protein
MFFPGALAGGKIPSGPDLAEEAPAAMPAEFDRFF